MDYNYLMSVYKNALDLDEFMGEYVGEGKVSDCLESWLLDILFDMYEDADDLDGEGEANRLLNNHRVQSEIKRLERATDWLTVTIHECIPDGHFNILGMYVQQAVKDIFKKELGI